MPSFILNRVAFIDEPKGFFKITPPIMKYIMDKLGSTCALVLLSPIFLILIALVRRDGGPAFFVQDRVGRNGKIFKCWKFRTMVVDAEARLQEVLDSDPEVREHWEKYFKIENDPRITKVGHFLRKTSLDELPQFYNVLCGDMSLVGPRPIMTSEKVSYGDKLPKYLSVNPGITGPWQISGRSTLTFDKRVELDTQYIRNWSLWGDIEILFKTVFVVLGRRGAY